MNRQDLQALLDKQVKGDIHNAVVGVRSKDGRVNHSAAAGDAQPGRAMTTETPYLLASISKMYTAAVIMQLWQEGRLALEAPIADYLPADLIDGLHVYQGTDYSRRIQVVQLLAQTSGLADYFEGKPQGGRSLLDDLKAGRDRTLDIQQVVDIARSMPPNFAPGTRAAYSDTNFQLLGAIIEAVSGQSVEEAFQARIFAPLGLEHTTVYQPDLHEADPPLAEVYNQTTPLHLPGFFSTITPDGGLVATVDDSLAFLQAFFEGRLFEARHLARMMGHWNRIFFPMQYGYGIMRFKLPRLFSPFKPIPEFVGHSGSTGSFAFYCPAKAMYLAGTVNQLAAQRKPFNLMVSIVNAL